MTFSLDIKLTEIYFEIMDKEQKYKKLRDSSKSNLDDIAYKHGIYFNTSVI